MSSSPSSTARVSLWRIAGKLLRWSGTLLLALWSIVLFGWLLLHWGILPRIDDWRPRIEQTASQALGLPVRIGRIGVESRGWAPTFELQDVVLSDPAGRAALHLPQVRAVVSLASLLRFEPRFEQLLIERPTLEVRRDAQGRLFVAGIEVGASGGEGGSSPAADWFFRQPEFVLRQGTLRWVDEQRRAPPLALRDVDLVLRSGGLARRRHELRLDATPDAGWGERFSVHGRFTHPLLEQAGDLRHWNGQAYAELPRADLSRLRHHVTLPFELQEGDGALRLWSEWREGRPQALTADLALRSVRLRLAPDLEPLVLADLTGRLSGERQGASQRLSTRDLSFRTGDGRQWPAGAMELRWTEPAGEAPGGGALFAERIDLAILAQLAGRLPLGAPLRQLLAELAPQGRVEPLDVHWTGSLDRPENYRARVRAEGVTLVAQRTGVAPGHPGRPGVQGAAFDITATERGGEGVLRISDGALELPGVFEEARLPLQRFSARLNWTRQPRTGAPAGMPGVLEVQAREVRFSNADAEGELQATWRTGADAGRRYPGELDLKGRLLRADATRAWRYLPQALPEEVRDYVRHAVQAGHSRRVDFRVRGDLREFPASDPRHGEFRIAAQVEGVRLAYVPDTPEGASPWPALTDVHGELVFEGSAMHIRDARARLYGVELGAVRGSIADLNQPVLKLEGNGRGPLADALRFVDATPIGEWTHGALAKASGSGAVGLRLNLSIPLARLEDSAVRGALTLQGNELRITPDAPLMSAARGVVEFSESGFALRDAAARLYGGEARFSGGSQPDGSLRFAGQGVASAEGLRQGRELSWLPYLAEHLSGQAPYQAELGIVDGQLELGIRSPLTGMAVALPEPFAKPAGAALPLRLQMALEPDTPAGRLPRDRLQLEVGSVLRADYTRELAPEGARVLRGGIAVNGAPLPQPPSGVAAALQLATLDLDVWQRAAEGLPEDFGAPAGASGGTPGADAGAGYMPTQFSVRADALVFDGRRLERVVAGLSQDAGLWRASFDAAQLAGYAEYRLPRAAGGGIAGKLYARLARLDLPEGEHDGVEVLLDQQPASVPALDIVIEDFTLHGLRLGRLEVEAVNRNTGEIREWRLNRFAVTTPEARLNASGNWLGVRGGGGGQRRAAMDFRLDVADSGALLERFGQKEVLRGGRGHIGGRLSWVGSPLSLDYPTLGGQLEVEIGSGRFLKAEPGLAKLLGVLSLQALPRRLALDFRDVFQEGFAFDTIRGDVKIAAGQAHTNNLLMRGVQAAVLMEGRADLARETQNLRVVVVPEINAGTASLAYAVINPAVGLGTFLAQMFLRKPLMQASTREFSITGSWSDPQVEAVKRRPDAPLPDLPALTAPPRAAEPPAAGG